ncbi:MAG: hypothetical protein U0Z53_05090 [Blastocatellia bacterium]
MRLLACLLITLILSAGCRYLPQKRSFTSPDKMFQVSLFLDPAIGVFPGDDIIAVEIRRRSEVIVGKTYLHKVHPSERGFFNDFSDQQWVAGNVFRISNGNQSLPGRADEILISNKSDKGLRCVEIHVGDEEWWYILDLAPFSSAHVNAKPQSLYNGKQRYLSVLAWVEDKMIEGKLNIDQITLKNRQAKYYVNITSKVIEIASSAREDTSKGSR